MRRRDLERVRRVVVKVGTSLLASLSGQVRPRQFGTLAQQVAALHERGLEVILVTSGAVGLGVRRLGLEAPRSIPEKQAAAAVGQIDLVKRYQRAFARFGLDVGQILLSQLSMADREGFLNARHTIHTLLAGGIVPVINENDSVATEELRFGDNDLLAALVVNSSEADLLLVLTDTDGLHDRPPGEPGAVRIPEVREVTPSLLARVDDQRGSGLSSGGIRSKLEAARAVARFGIPCVIARGTRRDVLARVLAGEDIGTLFHPAATRLSSRKHWIAYSLKPRGTLHLDAGAERALRERGRSLLPIGVVDVEGRFRVGDAVRCVTPSGVEIARGLTSYDADEARVIKGHRSPRIDALLGYSNGDAVIHRDDLVLL